MKDSNLNDLHDAAISAPNNADHLFLIYSFDRIYFSLNSL